MNHAKREIRNKIDRELDKINSLTVLADIEFYIEKQKPLKLKDYIKESFKDGKISGAGCKEINNQPAILQAFEHEVRAICLELGHNFEKVEAGPFIDHFCEMYVQGHELDIWIHENGSLFNPCELAFVIYLLYTGEVVF